MSNTVSKGTGRLLVRLLLSILLVFTLLGTAGGVLGGLFLSDAGSGILVHQLQKQNAAGKAYTTLQTKWETEYNTTAIPAEVYTGVITEDWMADAMERYIHAAWANLNGADTLVAIDSNRLTPLEDAITAYFEDFAEENSIEKDDAYTEKLNASIQNAEDAVIDGVDVCHVRTMMDAGIWAKLQKLGRLLRILGIVCAAASIVLMVLLRRQFCYWTGCSLFAGGLLLGVPAAVVLCSNIISRFTLKQPAVYAVCTGLLTQLVTIVLVIGAAMAVVGLVMWTGSMLRTRKKAAADQTAAKAA